MHLFSADSTEKQSLQYVNSMNNIVCCFKELRWTFESSIGEKRGRACHEVMWEDLY